MRRKKERGAKARQGKRDLWHFTLMQVRLGERLGGGGERSTESV